MNNNTQQQSSMDRSTFGKPQMSARDLTRRRLNEFDLQVMIKLINGKHIVPMPNVGGFRFDDERDTYGSQILDRLKFAEYLDGSNRPTGIGIVWVTLHEINL